MSQFMHCHDTAVYIDCRLGLVYVKLHVFRVMVMLRFLSRAPVCLAFPPPPLLFALNLPCRLEDAADALSGMVNSDWLLLRGYLSYLLHVSPTSAYHAHCETRTCKGPDSVAMSFQLFGCILWPLGSGSLFPRFLA
jgi:hypothetical protein